MGMPDGCQMMKVTRIAVDRLEMGDIILRNPQGVCLMEIFAIIMEYEFVFRMVVADRKMELAGTYTFIIYNRVTGEDDGRTTVFADSHYGQGVHQTYRVTNTVRELETGAHQIIDGTLDGCT